MIALLLLLACGARPPVPVEEATGEATPPPVATSTSAEPDPASSPTSPALTGTWRSLACGERTYPRELTIDADGTWEALDLVAPCPPGAMCVWSGVVPSEGTWIVDGPGIALTEAGPPAGPGRPRPTRLDPDPEGARSTEPDGSCLYTSAGSSEAQPVEERAEPGQR